MNDKERKQIEERARERALTMIPKRHTAYCAYDPSIGNTSPLADFCTCDMGQGDRDRLQAEWLEAFEAGRKAGLCEVREKAEDIRREHAKCGCMGAALIADIIGRLESEAVKRKPKAKFKVGQRVGVRGTEFVHKSRTFTIRERRMEWDGWYYSGRTTPGYHEALLRPLTAREKGQQRKAEVSHG